MDHSLNEIMSHPLMAQVHADLEAQGQKREADQREAQMATAQLRAEQGKFLSEQYDAMVAEYEAKRKELHECAGRVFLANRQYQQVTGRNISTFPEGVFLSINTPSLLPQGLWSINFDTVRAATALFFANNGKWV